MECCDWEDSGSLFRTMVRMFSFVQSSLAFYWLKIGGCWKLKDEKKSVYKWILGSQEDLHTYCRMVCTTPISPLSQITFLKCRDWKAERYLFQNLIDFKNKFFLSVPGPIAAHKIFSCGMWTLSWDLVSWPAMDLGLLHWKHGDLPLNHQERPLFQIYI